jgi:hypothetical protein
MMTSTPDRAQSVASAFAKSGPDNRPSRPITTFSAIACNRSLPIDPADLARQ